MPYAFIATVRNSGHMIHEEKSREINRKAIECLLETISAPPAEEKELPINDDQVNLEKIKDSFSRMQPSNFDIEG